MALNGEGEPTPTTLQVATQAATVELFRQWQTYRNGVHMDWDTFRSIDFESVASAVLSTVAFTTLRDEHVHAPVGPPVTLPTHRTLAGIRDHNSEVQS